MAVATVETTPADQLVADSLQRPAAQARDHPACYRTRQVGRLGQRPRVFQVARRRISDLLQLDLTALTADDLPDGRRKLQSPYGFRQPVVVGEDDDLMSAGDVLQDTGETIDLRRIHRLHRVVDDQESKGALGQHGAGEKK